MKPCFQIDERDNVATVLQDAAGGEPLSLRGSRDIGSLVTAEPIRAGHKVALTQIRAGQPIVKYGNPIGEATRAIQTGDWVHLHNCRSLHDAGSSVLDLESGVRSGDRSV
jgi:altronate dehydratase small subunit